MCEKSSLLIFILLIKIVAFIVIPIFLIILNRTERKDNIKLIFTIDIVVISLLIVLRILNNPCIKNSNFNYIRTNSYKESSTILYESNEENKYIEITNNNLYKTRNSRNVYYYNNSVKPLSEKSITCGNNKIYMKNYGNSLTTASIMLSTALNKNIDPIELLNLSVKNGVMDCDMGISIENALNLIQNNYNVHYTEIDNSILNLSLNNGIPVLAEVIYNSTAIKNLTCSKGYIVIYTIDNEGNYRILNPNETGSKIICPEQTDGALSIIEPESNDYSWSYDELMSIISRFWVVERN